MADNTWAEYSKLVLKELETLTKGIDNVESEISNIKSEIMLLKDKIEKYGKLEEWKEKVNEVASPTQLKTMIDEVEKLKEFKIKAITIFLVIQAITLLTVTYLSNKQ